LAAVLLFSVFLLKISPENSDHLEKKYRHGIMNKRFYCIIFFILILSAKNSYSQWEPSWNLGASIGGVSGINESVQQTLGFQFSINTLWLNGIAPHWSAELGIGSGTISSPNLGGYSQYSTHIVPIDLKVKFAPLDNPDWQPYLYAGFGLLGYSVNSSPQNVSSVANLSGTTTFLPIGIGLYHPIDKKWSIDIAVGDHPTFSDDLNPVHDGRNDGLWGFTIGITYTFGTSSSSEAVDEFDFGPRGTTRILATVTFDSASAKLKSDSEPILGQILSTLNNHSDFEVELRSYVDNSFDFYTSMALTQDRVETIKVWLVSRGISASRISTQAYGPHNPLVPNTTPENKKKNERIEIVRMK